MAIGGMAGGCDLQKKTQMMGLKEFFLGLFYSIAFNHLE